MILTTTTCVSKPQLQAQLPPPHQKPKNTENKNKYIIFNINF